MDEYGVAPVADSSPDQNGELRILHTTGSVDSDHVGNDDSTMYANDAMASSISTSTRVKRAFD